MTTVDLGKLEHDINQISIDANDVSINTDDVFDFYVRTLDDVRERPGDFGVCEDVQDSVISDLTEAVDELRDASQEASVLCKLVMRAHSEISDANNTDMRSSAVAHTLEQSSRAVKSVRDALDGAETCFISIACSAQENALTSKALKKLYDLLSDTDDIRSRLSEAEDLASEIARSSRANR